MGERLGEIAQHSPGLRVVFLRQQPHVVGQAEQALEVPPGLVGPALQDEVVDVPEAARQERAFARRQAVDFRAGRVPPDQAVRDKVRSIAATVPSIRGSSAGRNPTSGIMSRAASECSAP